MVQADVAGEELQHLWQPQIRAALERRLVVAPGIGALPVGILELVLDVEQPDADRAREQRGRHLNEQEALPAEQPAKQPDHRRERQVGAPHAAADPWPLAARDEAWREDHRPDRPQPEHHDRVADQPVAQPAVPRQRLVLGDRERRDIPDAAPVQIARGSVMDGVLVTPALKGREHQQPASGAEPLVRPAPRQQAAVSAVVKQDVGTHQKAGGGHRHREHQPTGDAKQEIHRHQQPQVRDQRRGDIHHAAAKTRPRVRSEHGAPRGLPPRTHRARAISG